METNLMSLPDEIILDIIEGLPFWDLKFGIPLVCRRFNNISKSEYLARALFKDIPRNPYDITTVFKINPLLQHAIIKRYTLLEVSSDPPCAISFFNLPACASGSESLRTSSLRTINATSPAVTQVGIQISHNLLRNPPSVDISGTGTGGSVTIGDVVNALTNLIRTDAERLYPGDTVFSNLHFGSTNTWSESYDTYILWQAIQLLLHCNGGRTRWVVNVEDMDGMVLLSAGITIGG